MKKETLNIANAIYNGDIEKLMSYNINLDEYGLECDVMPHRLLPNGPSKIKLNALNIAMENRNISIDMIKLLSEANLNINAVTLNGKTPLMIAVDSYREDIIKLLLDKGANLNIQDESGNTALMIAIDLQSTDGWGRNFTNIIELLLNAGTDCKKRNISNKTALGLTKHGQHVGIYNLLYIHGIRR